MGSKRREWTLDDGTVWTTETVMLKVGCAQGTAYYRLKRSSDPREALKSRAAHKITGGMKVYVLDDKSEWTARQVADYTGCKLSTASTRLSCYTDVDKVLAAPLHQTTKDRVVNGSIKKRMFFDPDGHWRLLMRNT